MAGAALMPWVTLPASSADAAACCLSSSVFGIGRLAIWETAAFGTLLMGAQDSGRWSNSGQWRTFPSTYTEQEGRADLWAIRRLHERVQVSGRVPWVMGIRSAAGVGQSVGGGMGDILLAGRWDAILAGEFKGWPAVAVTASLMVPTATRAEQATDALGAEVTGRGAWVPGLAVAVEKAVLPWFARVDAGLTLPLSFERTDLLAQQRYGWGWQGGLSAGRELVADRVVLGAQLVMDQEAPYTIDGAPEPNSGSRGLNGGVSLSWRVGEVWTLTASGSSDAPSAWIEPRNRTERWSATVGVRYAVQE